MTGANRHCRHRRRSARARGFTLMELLVVLGIFSTVVTAATDILMMSSRSQRKVFALEKTQSDARYTMEAVAREVRTGAIDYAWYAANEPLDATPAARTLALIDNDGDKLRFYVEQEESFCGAADNTPCIMVSVNDTALAPITVKGVQARYARFYITPKSDPFSLNPATGEFGADEQPRVTMVLVLESASQDPRERSVVHFQTTVASRSYQR